MRIAIASDHAGFRYKEAIIGYLEDHGHDVVDFGTDSTRSVDYPVFIHPAAQAVADGACERGIVLGGSGNGEAMAANRHRGVRCALCWTPFSAELARAHNDANMISIGERLLELDVVFEIVSLWLDTPFEGGRHERRIALIDEIDAVE
jgi:ribose 5-phosphate isomerase B